MEALCDTVWPFVAFNSIVWPCVAFFGLAWPIGVFYGRLRNSIALINLCCLLSQSYLVSINTIQIHTFETDELGNVCHTQICSGRLMVKYISFIVVSAAEITISRLDHCESK